MDLDLESHEVQPQYQDHVDIVPHHMNLKHETKYHHQMEMEVFIPPFASDCGGSGN